MTPTGNLKNTAIVCLVSAFLSLSFNAFSQDGTPDATFGTNGYAITNVSGTGDMGRSVLLLPDGKIILGGSAMAGAVQSFGLVRYWPSGTVDSTFGTNGRALAAFDGYSFAYLVSIKRQQDGKIVAAGNTNSNTFLLMRFTADGVVDSTFGANGRVVTTFTGKTASGNAMAIQADDKIVVAGNVGADIGVARYTANGALDATFGASGIRIVNFDAAALETANAVLVQPNGQILVGGATQTGPTGQFLLLRLTSTGNISTTFGNGGRITLMPRQTYNIIYGLTLQGDGKIVAVGLAKFTQSAFGIARFSKTGQPDSSFGTNGIVVHQFTTTNEEARDVAVQADGKLVVAGNINDLGSLQAAMVRLKSEGGVDSTFDYDGEVRSGQNNGSFAYSIAIQPDAKIVLGGYNYKAPTGNDFEVFRFNSPSVLPVTFTSFTATAVKNTTQLNWATAQEVNSSHFVIERSGGNYGFAAIGTVNSNGSSQAQQYSFTDAQPLKGDNYYRLKQVDKDGKFAYSKTVRITFGDAVTISAYPNPVVNSLQVSGLNAGDALTVVNAQGRTVSTHTATGSTYTINAQKLSAGLYYVRVQQGTKVTTLKVVKE